MNFRVVYISRQCRLSLKNNNLLVNNSDGETTVPMSDIAVVLIENLQCSLSAALLSSFADNRVVAIVCGNDHLPNGIILPYSGRTRMLEAHKLQQGISDDTKNVIWQKIIKNKIYNQASVLEYAKTGDSAKLAAMSKEVEVGDNGNMEAVAAQLYWRSIFSTSIDDFGRGTSDPRNAALNYGYAIVRSMIANFLACKGFALHDGIHHCSELNKFNLADDIIEPFRPFVDIEVYEIFENDGYSSEVLESGIKKRLLGIVDAPAFIGSHKYSLMDAIDKYCDNIYKCYKTGSSDALIEVNINVWGE